MKPDVGKIENISIINFAGDRLNHGYSLAGGKILLTVGDSHPEEYRQKERVFVYKTENPVWLVFSLMNPHRLPYRSMSDDKYCTRDSRRVGIDLDLKDSPLHVIELNHGAGCYAKAKDGSIWWVEVRANEFKFQPIDKEQLIRLVN